ncbi:MAG: ABC transporter permease [Rhodospirillaceae bacterium]|jgi:peptide/nickel transport system permease protein|nr:ABC transporter permease [Rhodospirillaceae bacterium]|tara:strand:+ start:964 stop:1848 length:885 start_codon:yes stop_codon:yes gene_type:complete
MVDTANGSALEGPFTRIFKNMALLRESPVGMVGAGIVLFFVVLAVFAPLVAPFDPNQSVLPFAKPLTLSEDGDFFLLGTDQLGRDILSRIIWGGQRVLFYATVATLCAYFVGIVMGLCAGYFRGWVDEVIAFFANVILSFPVMVLYVMIIAKVGASGANIVFAVVFASSPGIMRIVRGVTLDISTREYIAAAQTRGESPWYIMAVEILPNAKGPLIVDFCLRMGYTTITIGALGFLGLGLPPPDPDWGGMITETRAFIMGGFPHMAIIPACAVSLLVLGFNLLADGLREVSLKD